MCVCVRSWCSVDRQWICLCVCIQCVFVSPWLCVGEKDLAVTRERERDTQRDSERRERWVVGGLPFLHNIFSMCLCPWLCSIFNLCFPLLSLFLTLSINRTLWFLIFFLCYLFLIPFTLISQFLFPSLFWSRCFQTLKFFRILNTDISFLEHTKSKYLIKTRFYMLTLLFCSLHSLSFISFLNNRKKGVGVFMYNVMLAILCYLLFTWCTSLVYCFSVQHLVTTWMDISICTNFPVVFSAHNRRVDMLQMEQNESNDRSISLALSSGSHESQNQVDGESSEKVLKVLSPSALWPSVQKVMVNQYFSLDRDWPWSHAVIMHV